VFIGKWFHLSAGFSGTAEALAAQVTQENFDKGLIYPPFRNIRKISAEIAAKVAAKAYELGESFFVRIHPSAICSYGSLCIKIYVSASPFSLVGLATRLPPPKDLVKYAESCMYSPAYRSYRWSDGTGKKKKKKGFTFNPIISCISVCFLLLNFFLACLLFLDSYPQLC